MEYVTIKEAVQITGVSVSTIRRLVASKKKTKQVKKQKNQWLISKELLKSEYSLISQRSKDHSSTPKVKSIANDGDIVVVLKEQLQTKDKQIETLLERNGELNILLRESQNLLNGGTTPEFAKSKAKNKNYENYAVREKTFFSEHRTMFIIGGSAFLYFALMFGIIILTS